MKKLVNLCFALIIISCGNSVEIQQSYWVSNKEKVERYSVKYPYLADAINTQFLLAKEQMDIANGISDEKKRISAMKSANSICLRGPVTEVEKFENACKSLKDEIRFVKDKFKPEEFSQKTHFLLSEANDCLNKADAAFSAKYSSAETALSVFKNISEELSDIELGIEKHYKEVTDIRSKENEKITGTGIPSDNMGNSSDSSKVVATIKCNKCGSKLLANDINCKNCGAPVKE